MNDTWISQFWVSMTELVAVGGFVMPPLIIATFVLWFAVGVRHAVLKRGSQRSVRNLIARYRTGQRHKAKGIVDTAIKQGLAIKQEGIAPLRPYLDDAFADYYIEIKRYSVLIAAIVVTAPLAGLLGTVVGMIETFDSLGDMTLFAQSGGIAGGISQALFTTQMGLAIAVPGLIAKSWLDRRQARIEMDLAQVKDLLTSQ